VKITKLLVEQAWDLQIKLQNSINGWAENNVSPDRKNRIKKVRMRAQTRYVRRLKYFWSLKDMVKH